MRQARLLVPPGMEGVYHVVSRVVDRRMVFGEEEKRHFLKLMKGYAGFSGLSVISWCLMDNHFHMLVAVPEKSDKELPEKVVLGRMALVYNGRQMKEFRAVYDACKTPQGRRALLQPYVRRMGDLGLFMKTLKQRFTQWFNRKHARTGTLWEGRFRSTIVEFETGLPVVVGTSREAAEVGDHAARIVAAYIDLNPVRAGMVEDPKDYAWSSYGAAVRGDKLAVKGIQALWGGRTKAEALAAHRVFVFEEGAAETEDARQQDRRGEENGMTKDNAAGPLTPALSPQAGRGRPVAGSVAVPLEGASESLTSVFCPQAERGGALAGAVAATDGKGRKGIDVKKVWAERQRGGRLPLGVLLRMRVRYLTDGAVVGSKEFVERVTGGRGVAKAGKPMRFGQWGGLHALRNLRVNVVGA